MSRDSAQSDARHIFAKYVDTSCDGVEVEQITVALIEANRHSRLYSALFYIKWNHPELVDVTRTAVEQIVLPGLMTEAMNRERGYMLAALSQEDEAQVHEELDPADQFVADQYVLNV